jgi:hypothetical protein
MRTRAALLSMPLVAALALGACGSDTKTISKADYVSKGNQLCAAAQKKIQSLKTPQVDPNSDLTKAQMQVVGDFLDQGVTIQNDLIKKLRALGTPKADDKKLQKIYDTSDTGAGQIQKAADAAHAGKLSTMRTQLAKGGQTLDQAQKDINAYGLTECGNTNS